MTDHDVVVEQLFEETDLSDDPVFVAYLPERDTLTVAENGVDITGSNVQFAFFEPGELGVLTVESEETGDFSTLLDHVCDHFGVDDVLFINVVSQSLADAVHGFERTARMIGGVEMDCLEGTWGGDADGA